MRYIILFLLFPIVAYSYQNDTVINGEQYVARYFNSGEISTLIIKLDCKNKVFNGFVKAFDRSGKVIYENNIRCVAGYSSINFSYYKDGAVKKAHYTSAPDGGIQRTDITHYFSNKGNITKIIDLSSNGFEKSKLSELIR